MDHLYLVHHGIKGQKWGVRNGPPYPLGESDKSASEKKAKRINKFARRTKESSKPKEKFWTDDRKRIAKGVAIVAGVALVAYGGYKVSQLPAVQERLGKKTVEEILSSNLPSIDSTSKDAVEFGRASHTLASVSPGTKADAGALGKSLKDIDLSMVRDINSSNHGAGGKINCTHCAMSYITNSLFHTDCSALPFDGVDEASGMVMSGGRRLDIFSAAFDGIAHIKPTDGESFGATLSRLPRKSTGILALRSDYGHVVNYEKDWLGRVVIIDSQRSGNQVIRVTRDIAEQLSQSMYIQEVLDFSNATIREGAQEVFKHCLHE